MAKNITKEQYAKLCGNRTYGTCTTNYSYTETEYKGKFIGNLKGNADTATALKNNWSLNLTKDVQGTAILNNSNTNLEVTVLESKHAVNADNAKQTQECAHSSLADLANLATFALETELAHNAIKAEQDVNGVVIHDTYLKIADGVLKSEYLKSASVKGKAIGSGTVVGTDLQITIDEIANNITNNFIFINEAVLPPDADSTKIYINTGLSLMWVYNNNKRAWQELFTDVREELTTALENKSIELNNKIDTETLKIRGEFATADTALQATLENEIGEVRKIAENALPLKGGTVTGPIVFSNVNEEIKNAVDTSDLRIYGGSGAGKGGGLFLYGNNSKSFPGRAVLTSHNTNSRADLILDSDGKATWASKNLVRTVNGATADTAGNINISGVPTGSLIPFAGAKVPSGFLLCNGATVSRTTYAKLFSVIGEKWGAGDGSTTFNLPDFTDKYIKGTTNADNVGKPVEAGLPNITGHMRISNQTGFTYAGEQQFGCFVSDDTVSGYTHIASGSPNSNARSISFLASFSNGIYKDNFNTVEVSSNQTLMIIKT